MTFEKEFEIHSEVWSKLVDLREATINLRPILDTIDPNEPEEERRKKRLQQFAICHNEFFSVVCKNEPFYPSEIYQRLMRIKQIATMEFSQYRISYPPRAKDWENAKKILKK